MRLAPAMAAFLCLAAPAWSEAPGVVTDIAPVHALARQVMAGVGSPALLLPAQADPHHFHMRPSQSRQLQDADILFWVGEDLTPWLAEIVEQTSGDTQHVELLHTDGTHTHAFDHDDDTHDDDHGHGETDPHAWLDPENATVWLYEMADRLAELDPANAALYQANAAAEATRISAAAEQARAVLDVHPDVQVVFLHDAFAYFSEAFGLKVLGAIQDGDATTPGAARLRGLRQAIAQADAVCVFPEEGQSDKYLAAVTEGTGAKIGAMLNPLGVDEATGYPGLITRLATAIADCASGL